MARQLSPTSPTSGAGMLVGALDACVVEEAGSVSSSNSDESGEDDDARELKVVDSDSHIRLFLGVHNIDGPSLRTPDTQTAIR